jgi:hypothetical protein
VACRGVKLPGGATAIVCGPKPRYPRCRFCKVQDLYLACDATLLCDFVVAKTLGGADMTCDTPVCTHCARRVGDKDFCPKH